MTPTLSQIKKLIFDPLRFHFSGLEKEAESQEYEACRFQLNELNVICRTAKITPKKQGQFVTFWKREINGPIEPFSTTDAFNFYLVIIQDKEKVGLFVFPKAVLLGKGILTSAKKEGKRAFRVYPPWVKTLNQQAVKTQKWQSDYFLSVYPDCDLPKARNLLRLE